MSYQEQEFQKQENQNIIQLIFEFSKAQMLKICFSDLNEQLIVKQIKITDYLKLIKQIQSNWFNLDQFYIQSLSLYCAQQYLQEQFFANTIIQFVKTNLSIDSTESAALMDKKPFLQFFCQNIQESEERLLKNYNLALQCSQITRTGQKKQKETNLVRELLQEIRQELQTIRNISDFNTDSKDQNNQFEQLQSQLKKLVQLFGKEEEDLYRDSQLQNNANNLLSFIFEINNKQDITKIMQIDINAIIKNQVTQIILQIQETFQKENQDENEIGSNNQNTIFSNLNNISIKIHQCYQQYKEQRLNQEKIISDIVVIDELQFSLFKLQQQRNPNLSQHISKEIIEFKETLNCQFVNDSEVFKEFQQLQGEFLEQKCQLNGKYDFQNVHALEFLRAVENEQKIDLKLDDVKVGWLSEPKGNDWHVRESLFFIQQIFSHYQNKQIVIKQVTTETDIRVKATFKHAETLQVMNNVVGKYWDEMENSIQQQVDDKLKRLRAIQLYLQSIEKEEERVILIQEYKDIEEQIQNQSENVKEIGDALGFTIGFLKNIKKDLETLEQQLDKILKNVEQLGQKIKFLRGKSPQQMFEIRMQQVLQNKLINDANSVYVQLLTNEMDFIKKTLGRKDGEVDEFLFQDKKDSLLIHGVAGPGKSLAAQKIEEYMWIQYQQKTKLQKWQNNQSIIPIIPIFKVITTSRTEAFVKKEYQEWFCCDEKLNLDFFKEIKIKPFDIDQQNSFWIQFSKMKIKNHIIDLSELICKKESKKKEMVFVIQNVWLKLQKIVLVNLLKIYNYQVMKKQDILLKQLKRIIKQLILIKNKSLHFENSWLKHGLQADLMSVQHKWTQVSYWKLLL